MKNILKIVFVLFAVYANAQTQLYIPDTISGPNISLLMHKDSVQFLPGQKTNTYGFNSNKYLGPTLILNNGNNVSINVDNQIGDTTTIHWHGLHVAPSNDGGPHTMIMPGMMWNPAFTVLDKASTYWYHPHFMGKTALHVMQGAAGLIIVRDPQEAALNLPRSYGVDDIPLIIQSQQFDSVNQIEHRGMEDSLMIVNGLRANYGNSVYANLPAQIVRLRLLNASGERSYNFGLTANKQFKVIGTDGGLLNAPVTVDRIRVSPGERYEILVDLTGMNGQTIYLMCYGSELPSGIQGGPTMPMPIGSPPMDSPLNGNDFNILQINVVAQTASPVTSIPATLVNATPYLQSQASAIRKIDFTADSAMVMDGPFYFNDSTFNMMRIDYRIPINSVEIWQLTNQTMVAHPFHIHDVQFYILDRNGLAPALEESGRKDVVLLAPGDTVRFITKFEDFADTLTPYMFHCHILMHEDDGMMGQFVVTPLSAVGINELYENNNSSNVYPNPASSSVNIEFKGINSVIIYNSLGAIVCSDHKVTDHIHINTSGWSKGIYSVQINGNDQSFTKKLIIN